MELLGRFWAKAHASESHHPDRGGDVERLQAINDAMRLLDDYYR